MIFCSMHGMRLIKEKADLYFVLELTHAKDGSASASAMSQGDFPNKSLSDR